jgi:RNA polymerase sigma-70 factor (ECF subfamily)
MGSARSKREGMDQDLVVRAQHGDQQAFQSLTVAHHARLYRVAYGILRDRHLAEDATQQAFLDVWRNLPTLEEPTRFSGWSYRILVHACYVEARRKPNWADENAIGPADVPAAPDEYGSVIDRDQLERGFRRLSVEHRTIIVLRCLLDLPMDQVADALGISKGTVGSRLSRAVMAMRAALEAESRTTTPVTTSISQGVAR